MAIRFLVVDDATFIRDMVKKQLRDRVPGAEVFDAADGNRAIAQLKKQRVDVILSDWEMPGMSGGEFLEWIRSHEDFSAVPFIMVTSRGDRDHVMKAVQAGVSDFITKPFSSDELIKKVLKQLKKINKLPPAPGSQKQAGQTQGVAMASVDALTGGAPSITTAPKVKPAAESDSVSALTGGASRPQAASQSKPAATSDSAAALTGAAPPPKPKAAPKKGRQGKAQLRFSNATCACVIKDMSLQAMSGLMQRTDPLPSLFDQAVVDIETESGDEVARVNGYLSSMTAAENKVDTQIIRVTIQFVDNDPEKFEFLSKFIAKTR
ncbi:MAG: response regulator [Candidatus Pelagadaptatus aseana]|uniref:response regulator n=1 Tax=Candidatus Pelagadaptatus aseana TaxID=3120508 RepID=UPI0039B25721